MRKYSWLLSLLLLLPVITACGPAAPIEPNLNEDVEPVSSPVPATEPTQPAAENNTDAPDPTHTPPPIPDSYPAPPTPAPLPDGYPAQPVIAPTTDPYPGAYPVSKGFVWMLRPVGEQCAEAEPDYTDLKDAKAALTAAGFAIGNAEMADLMVCSACGCPTSAHFRIQIDAGDVTAAESLGWSRE